MKYNVSVIFKEDGAKLKRIRAWQKRLFNVGFELYITDKYSRALTTMGDKIIPTPASIASTEIKAVYNSNDRMPPAKLISSLKKSGLLKAYREYVDYTYD